MTDLIIPAAKRVDMKSGIVIGYELPEQARDPYWFLVYQLEKKGIVYHQLKIARPFKPRTTGKGSQCNHLNGHVRQLCMQTGYDFDVMKEFVKRKAIKRGWPMDTAPDGEAYPRSETKVSSQEINAGIEECHQLAAELDIPLREESW